MAQIEDQKETSVGNEAVIFSPVLQVCLLHLHEAKHRSIVTADASQVNGLNFREEDHFPASLGVSSAPVEIVSVHPELRIHTAYLLQGGSAYQPETAINNVDFTKSVMPEVVHKIAAENAGLFRKTIKREGAA